MMDGALRHIINERRHGYASVVIIREQELRCLIPKR